MEIWKEIYGLEGIAEVSDAGRIKTLPYEAVASNGKKYKCAGKIRNLSINRGGYQTITLGPLRKTFLVHTLVATTFIPNHNLYPEVNHIDGNKTNNQVSNLEWCNRSQNMLHASKKGLFTRSGENNGFNKVKEIDVKDIRKLYSSGTPIKDISDKYNMSRQNVSRIINRKRWAHVI